MLLANFEPGQIRTKLEGSAGTPHFDLSIVSGVEADLMTSDSGRT
jgi:hypothetical protein